MNELALFAGAGGGILGGMLCGWRTVCAVEIEDYPRRVLLQRQADAILPRFPIWDDVRTFDGKPWRGKSTSLQVDFHAKTYPSTEKGQDYQVADPDYGSRWCGLLVKYNQDLFSSRTVLCSEQEDYEKFSKTLPKWGTMRNGELLEQIPPVRHTNAIVSGYWPTPKSRDWKGQSQRGIYAQGDALPNMDRGDGKPIGGNLNTDWVEWLMGWPIGWTDLKPLEMDKFQQWFDLHFIF